jgi:hypothetical protein
MVGINAARAKGIGYMACPGARAVNNRDRHSP